MHAAGTALGCRLQRAIAKSPSPVICIDSPTNLARCPAMHHLRLASLLALFSALSSAPRILRASRRLSQVALVQPPEIRLSRYLCQETCVTVRLSRLRNAVPHLPFEFLQKSASPVPSGPLRGAPTFGSTRERMSSQADRSLLLLEFASVTSPSQALIAQLPGFSLRTRFKV